MFDVQVKHMNSDVVFGASLAKEQYHELMQTGYIGPLRIKEVLIHHYEDQNLACWYSFARAKEGGLPFHFEPIVQGSGD